MKTSRVSLAALAGAAAIAAFGAHGATAAPEEVRPKRALEAQTGAFSATERLPELERIRELRREITLVNLLNGIHLSEHQLRHVLEAAREAEAVRARAARAGRLGETVAALEALEREAERDAIGKETEQRATRLNEAAKEIQQQVQREIDRIAERLEECLLAGQKDALGRYKPCLILPRDFRDPVRVGQAHHPGPAVKLLERMRSMPEALYRARRAEIVERVVSRGEERFGKIPEDRRGEELARVGSILDRARAMDEVRFELEKESIAEELAPLGKRLEDELHAMRETVHPRRSKVAEFLLDPRIIPIVERRLAWLAEAPAASKADLDAIKGAPRCEKGQCGLETPK